MIFNDGYSSNSAGLGMFFSDVFDKFRRHILNNVGYYIESES